MLVFWGVCSRLVLYVPTFPSFGLGTSWMGQDYDDDDDEDGDDEDGEAFDDI